MAEVAKSLDALAVDPKAQAAPRVSVAQALPDVASGNKPNWNAKDIQGVDWQTWNDKGWSWGGSSPNATGDSAGRHAYAGESNQYFVVEPEVEKYLRAQGYTGSLKGAPLDGYDPSYHSTDRYERADQGKSLGQNSAMQWTRSPELDSWLNDRGYQLQSGRYQVEGERQGTNLQRLVDKDGNPLAVNSFNDRTTAMEKASRAATGALLLYTGYGLMAPAAGGAAGGGGAGAGLGAEAAAAGAAPAGGGLAGGGLATNPALIESALGTAGYGASSAGAGGMGAAGAAGSAGSVAANMNATNPALIDSALGTPGYGASSAGSGGGAGTLSSGGSKWTDLLDNMSGQGGGGDGGGGGSRAPGQERPEVKDAAPIETWEQALARYNANEGPYGDGRRIEVRGKTAYLLDEDGREVGRAPNDQRLYDAIASMEEGEE